MLVEVHYFERPGPVNTEAALELGIRRACALGIEHLVVPSITGRSAALAAQRAQRATSSSPLRVVCVTYRAGGAWNVQGPPPGRHWHEIPELKQQWDHWQAQGYKHIGLDEAVRKQLSRWGVPVVQATDISASVESSMTGDLAVSTPKTVMKETLFLLCAGLKVAVFTTMAAADAGLVPVDREVVAFGGTEQGLDTAVVIKPSYSDSAFDPRHGLEIREIVCKPRSMMGPSGYYHDRAWGASA